MKPLISTLRKLRQEEYLRPAEATKQSSVSESKETIVGLGEEIWYGYSFLFSISKIMFIFCQGWWVLCLSLEAQGKVRRQPVGVCSLLPLCESQGLKSGCQAWWQASVLSPLQALPRTLRTFEYVRKLDVVFSSHMLKNNFSLIFLLICSRYFWHALFLTGASFSFLRQPGTQLWSSHQLMSNFVQTKLA